MRSGVPCALWMKERQEVNTVIHVDFDDVNSTLVVTGCRQVADGWVVDVRGLTDEEKLVVRIMES